MNMIVKTLVIASASAAALAIIYSNITSHKEVSTCDGVVITDVVPPKVFKTDPVTPPIVVVTPPPHKPSEIELLQTFLSEDKISDNEYDLENNYTCMDFSIELAKSLVDNGYDAGVTKKSAKYHSVGGGHMITWVIIGGKPVYIEPQNDGVVDMETFLSDDHVIRDISIKQAERNRDEMRRWR